MKVSTVSSILLVAQTASAFAPTKTSIGSTIALHDTTETTEPVATEEVNGEPNMENSPFTSASVSPVSSSVAAINGWVPDDTKPCFGLPGALAPTGYFDPIGFCRNGIDLGDVKRYRESEVMHGRVAMLATVGYFAGEAFSGPFTITGPANDQLQQVPLPAFLLLTAGIAAAELTRAQIGWKEPMKFKSLWALRENYYPGDVGFDPLGLKPEDPAQFADMQTRELQNGRLAMLGWAGMCAQELVNHKSIMETFDFYQKVYSGINPYDGSAF